MKTNPVGSLLLEAAVKRPSGLDHSEPAKRAAPRRWRLGSAWLLGIAIGLAVVGPGELRAQAFDPSEVQVALERQGGGREFKAFYQQRDFQPLWLSAGPDSPAGQRLAAILASADLDGLDPDDYRPRAIADALDDARQGNVRALAKAELLLSRGFVAYVQDLRRQPNSQWVVADPGSTAPMPGKTELLMAAASQRLLADYVGRSGWMHPLYGELRKALAAADPDSEQAQILRLNLDRARPLPSGPGRHILVDTAGARLFMYDNGRLAGSMKVVVGRAEMPTPMLASAVRYATLNPYWNVPVDLVRERIAPEVVGKGVSYLTENRYEVLSDWSEHATVTDPKLVNWDNVLAGRQEVRVRQRPGIGNGMGKMKFMFPNTFDIYLHDTPDKHLFKASERRFSAGCIRLEDAPRLGRWLFGKPLTTASRTPELQVALPAPVPVYVTYFTAFPGPKGVAIRQDVYGRDRAALARIAVR